MFDEERREEFPGAWTPIGSVAESRTATWREIDRNLRRIARRRAEVDADEARWMLAAHRAEVHRALGHATFVEYMEHVLGYGPRVALDRLRVATALESLPATARALEDSELSYSAVRELTRVATTSTEGAWLEATRGKTVRQIEELVSGREPGELPGDPVDPDLRPQVLRFEVSPETRALLRDAERRLAVDHGHMLDDDELVAAMCRAVLTPTWARAQAAEETAEEAEAAPPRYQVAITRCDTCARGWQDGGGRAVAIGADAIETACCDAQVIGRVDRGGKSGVGAATGRATRTIPPATRRKVIRRDHGRCVVAGCRTTRWIDVHHLRPRAEGGGHEPENLACLCAAHHRAVHDGRLHIAGQPGALAFFHRDGRRWGVAPRVAEPEPAPPRSGDSARLAQQALRSMGYSTAEASAAVERARAHVGAEDGVAAWIRAALRACRVT